MTDQIATAVEVFAPGQLSSRELEDERVRQVVQAHEQVLRAGIDFIAAAGRVGLLLLDLRRQHKRPGTWRAWIGEHLPFTYATARLYMKCAENEALIREQGWTRLNQVKEGLGALIEPDNKGKGQTGKGKPEWMKTLAREMYADNAPVAHIARDLEVSPSAVRCWVDPAWEAESRRKVAAINKRRIRADRLLREQEREQAIRRAVRKKGGAIAKLYADAERTQDDIAQAQREATDSEARRDLAEAGALHRRYRDKIVRALGIT